MTSSPPEPATRAASWARANNLIFTSSDPTNSQTKTISGNIKVDGELKLENASTNEQLFLALDIDDYVITGSGSGDNQLVLGNNTRIKVSGADNLGETIGTFGNVELDKNSIVIFDATKGSQNIPVLNYGNISLYGSTVKKLEGTTTVRGWINVSSGTPILTIEDESIELYIEGDWKLAAANLNINPASTIVLCGIGNQEIVSTKFPNLHPRDSNTIAMAIISQNGNSKSSTNAEERISSNLFINISDSASYH